VSIWASYSVGAEALFLWIIRPGIEADHISLSSVKAKNEWICISTPPICLHEVYRHNITFTFLLNYFWFWVISAGTVFKYGAGGGSRQFDRSYDKWRCITKTQGGEEYPAYNTTTEWLLHGHNLRRDYLPKHVTETKKCDFCVKLFCSKLWLCVWKKNTVQHQQNTLLQTYLLKLQHLSAIRHHKVSEEYKWEEFQTIQYKLK